MKDIIGLLFYVRTIAHIEHLKTKSYAQHKALNEFYDEVVDLADKLAEAYQGYEGIIEDIPVFSYKSSDPIDVFLEKQLDTIEKLRAKASDRSAIQNIIDEIVGLILKHSLQIEKLIMIVTNTNAKELELVATITRADGTVEELGTISYWHKNPLMRIWWKIKQFFKGL